MYSRFVTKHSAIALRSPPAGDLRPAKVIVNGRCAFSSDLAQFTGTAPESSGDKDQGNIRVLGWCPVVQTVPIPPLATGIDLAPQERSMSKMKLLLASALWVALIDVPTYAAPTVPSMSQVHAVTLAQWHRGGGGWRRGGWGWGPWPWIGLGVVAGAIIADQAYRPHPGHYYDEGPYDGPYYYPSDYRGDPRTICAQNFRSFEWRSGYYTTYSGERRLCPYLREAALAPDAAPYVDARRPPPGADYYGEPGPPPGARPPGATPYNAAVPPPQSADPYGDPGPPPQGAVRPPLGATPYNAAVPLRQSADPYSDPGPAPQRAARGAMPYNSNAAPPPQGPAPYGDASPGDDDEGPPRDAGEPPGPR